MGAGAHEHCLDKDTKEVFQTQPLSNGLSGQFQPEQPHSRSC